MPDISGFQLKSMHANKRPPGMSISLFEEARNTSRAELESDYAFYENLLEICNERLQTNLNAADQCG